MNTTRYLLTGTALLAALFTEACEDNDGNSRFGDPFTLGIRVETVGEQSAAVTVTPSPEDAGYFMRPYPASEIAEKEDDALLSECLHERDFAKTVCSGMHTLPVGDLQPETDYVVLAFGYSKTMAPHPNSTAKRPSRPKFPRRHSSVNLRNRPLAPSTL